MTSGDLQFAAFLSYSRKDVRLARWLVRSLEEFRLPRLTMEDLKARRAPFVAARPVFRDEHDMPVGGVISNRLGEMLDASATMIVLCTASSAKSDWVNREIELFASHHPDRRIIPVVAEGEPDSDETYPLALLKHGKPLAADLRNPAERRQSVIKIAAAVLGVDVDQMVGRIAKRSVSRRRWFALAGAAAAGIVIALGVTAAMMSVNAREANALARQNVEKLLTDARDTLDEVGILKAKAAAHAVARDYFEGKGDGRLNEKDLLLKWEWLRQSGVDALESGDADNALVLRRQAHEATSELLRRNPDNPEFLFAHGQSAYYLGEFFYLKDDLEAARPHWAEYLTSAERLFEVAPDYVNDALETDALSEVAYARVNMGVLAIEQNRNARAAANQFASAIEVLAPRATTVNHKLNLTRGYKQYMEALAQFAPAGEVLAAIKPWEVNLAELDELSRVRRDLSFELATNWRAIAEIKKQAGLEKEAERDWLRTRSIIDGGLKIDAANKAWLRQAARLDASMGELPDCKTALGQVNFADDVASRNVELCLMAAQPGRRAEVCTQFADSLSGNDQSPGQRDRPIQETAWARLLSACIPGAGPALADRLNAIAADKFFSSDFHELRIRTQLALSEFKSDDQWISELNKDLKHRGWKGGQDGQ